jgi:hypothetical protein
VGVDRGEDFSEDDAKGEDDGHGVEDDGERAVCAGFVSLGAIAVEDGDHGDGDDASDEEVGEHVGELEGGVVSVGDGAGAEDTVDVPGADESQNSGEKRREHDEESCREDAVRGGGAKEGEEAGAGWGWCCRSHAGGGREGVEVRVGVFVCRHGAGSIDFIGKGLCWWGGGGGSL